MMHVAPRLEETEAGGLERLAAYQLSSRFSERPCLREECGDRESIRPDIFWNIGRCPHGNVGCQLVPVCLSLFKRVLIMAECNGYF